VTFTGDQSVRIAVAFAKQSGSAPNARLCAACVDVLEVSGAGITLMSGRNAGPVCVSSERTGELEDLQFSLGEGPCQDAFASGAPVHAPDLDANTARWPTFVAQAVDVGFGAVFAFPLTSDRSRFGVLTLYQDDAGELSTTQEADSLAVAHVLTETMLSMQAASPVDELAQDLSESVAHRAEVHQATGMVAVQLAVSVEEAMARLRAYSYAEERPLADVAADVVARRLRLADDR
jgi:hypothetical protein